MAGVGTPPEIERWEVDRADYKGTSFDVGEMKDLVKRGWIDRTDGVRPAGSVVWTSAQDHPALAKAFALRAKSESAKFSASAVRKALTCANHPKAKARWRCETCGRVFCNQCTNESELRDKAVELCVECDVPMTPLAAPA